jgi:hypothetical protein
VIRPARMLSHRHACSGVFAALLALNLAALAACGASGEVLCKPDPITGSQQCTTTSSNPASAVVTTGVAAGVYAVTGCTVNGCQLPDVCNPKTKRCEPTPCNEQHACPAGYECDLTHGVCR